MLTIPLPKNEELRLALSPATTLKISYSWQRHTPLLLVSYWFQSSQIPNHKLRPNCSVQDDLKLVKLTKDADELALTVVLGIGYLTSPTTLEKGPCLKSTEGKFQSDIGSLSQFKSTWTLVRPVTPAQGVRAFFSKQNGTLYFQIQEVSEDCEDIVDVLVEICWNILSCGWTSMSHLSLFNTQWVHLRVSWPEVGMLGTELLRPQCPAKIEMSHWYRQPTIICTIYIYI